MQLDNHGRSKILPSLTHNYLDIHIHVWIFIRMYDTHTHRDTCRRAHPVGKKASRLAKMSPTVRLRKVNIRTRVTTDPINRNNFKSLNTSWKSALNFFPPMDIIFSSKTHHLTSKVLLFTTTNCTTILKTSNPKPNGSGWRGLHAMRAKLLYHLDIILDKVFGQAKAKVMENLKELTKLKGSNNGSQGLDPSNFPLILFFLAQEITSFLEPEKRV